MTSKNRSVLTSIILIGILLLTACQTTATPAPTLDTNLIYTQAAQTIEAGNRMTEAARPTEAPTATPEPSATATLEPTVDAPATATAMAQLQATAATTGTIEATATTAGVVQPTATATLFVVLQPTATTGFVPAPVNTNTPVVEQRGELVSLSPARGTSVKRNASWDMRIEVKNTGSSTWDSGYYIGYYRGEKMGSPDAYYLTKEVKPGESFTFAFVMTAPDSTGGKQVYWVLRSASGTDILYIDMEVNVTD